MSVKMALLANLLSALSCYIGLAIGIYIGQSNDVRFWIFAIAAGMFLYVALVDMVSNRDKRKCGSIAKRKNISFHITYFCEFKGRSALDQCHNFKVRTMLYASQVVQII